MEADSTRKKIRKDILGKRDQLSEKDLAIKSKAIFEKLFQLESFILARRILFYVNFRSEVKTLPIIQKCLLEGKRISVPLTVPSNSRLIPYLIKDPVKELRHGYCGIPEPDPKLVHPVSPGEIDVAIVPGSVFDENGGRLGYGGGYYDRFLLNDAPQALRVGLAFELQMVREVPVLPHDQFLHYVITEKRIISSL